MLFIQTSLKTKKLFNPCATMNGEKMVTRLCVCKYGLVSVRVCVRARSMTAKRAGGKKKKTHASECGLHPEPPPPDVPELQKPPPPEPVLTVPEVPPV